MITIVCFVYSVYDSYNKHNVFLMKALSIVTICKLPVITIFLKYQYIIKKSLGFVKIVHIADVLYFVTIKTT